MTYAKNSKTTLTAIRLLLTEPRPLDDELKCSITSQLDFLVGLVELFAVGVEACDV